MSIRIVIGKNFGDEGKGLAVDYFAAVSEKAGRTCLVIRHNGGAQAGHTVDLKDKRFVFSQLSSGSFRHADTYLADSFLFDPYALKTEANGFACINRSFPKMTASGNIRCVTVLDVLLNQALEDLRGTERHGSCGMGIDETVRRSATTFRLPLNKVKYGTAEEIFDFLKGIRAEYLPSRLEELNLSIHDLGKYRDLINNDIILRNWAEAAVDQCWMVELVDPYYITRYDDIIFEGAQGLLLDNENKEYAPHLTTSRTGLTNPVRIIRDVMPAKETEAEAAYVTRSYVTRHGNGPLPNESSFTFPDETNIPNEWQGSLRFAHHGSIEDFLKPVQRDIDSVNFEGTHSFFITHLNEMDLPYKEELKTPLYLSSDKYSDNVRYQK